MLDGSVRKKGGGGRGLAEVVAVITCASAFISGVANDRPKGSEEGIIYLKDVFYGRIKCFCPHQFISIKANAFERTHIFNHT